MTDHADHIEAAHRAERWVKDRGEYLTPAEGVSPLPPGGADTRVVYSYADYFAVALVYFEAVWAAGVRERQPLRDALAWALDCLELSLGRIDAVDETSPEHLRLRAAGLAKARAVLAGGGDGRSPHVGSDPS